MALSADQVYLLNTLAYMSKEGVLDAREGQTIGDFASNILNSKRLQNALKDDFLTVEQIQSACNQIVKDESLCAMTFEHASRTEGGADCFVITTPEGTGERQAVVVFEGTTGGVEWRDDFQGGMATDGSDGVSTDEQEKALAWYRSDEIQDILNDCDKITVSGHSKGGNKAKYLTLLDDSVDECISFDGQGFSDEFVRKYADEIRQRQNKITNYNNKNDYVNILLNDMGETHYIEGTDTKNFMENHSLFTLCQSIPLMDHTAPQNPLLSELDQVLNGFLRSISEEERRVFLDMAGELTADLLGGDEEFGLDDAADYIEMLFFDSGKDVLGKFLKYFAAYAGYELTEVVMKWLRNQFPYLRKWIDEIIATVEKKPGLCNGADIRYGADRIVMDTDTLASLAGQLRKLRSELDRCASQISACAAECDDYHLFVKISLTISLILSGASSNLFRGTPAQVLRDLNSDIRKLSDRVTDLAGQAEQIAGKFEETEDKIIASIPDVF